MSKLPPYVKAHNLLCRTVRKQGRVRATLAFPVGRFHRGQTGTLAYMRAFKNLMVFKPDGGTLPMPVDLFSMAWLHIPQINHIQQ